MSKRKVGAKREHLAWAIMLKSGALAGRYVMHTATIPDHMLGCFTALWETRAKAKAAAATLYADYAYREPVRVWVSVRLLKAVRGKIK